MSKLIEALRQKYRSPAEAVAALGLDTALIEDAVGGQSGKEGLMSTKQFSPVALVAIGAVKAFLRPRLAQDQKVAVGPLLDGVTGANFRASIPRIVADLKTATAGRLAQDADVGEVAEALEALAGELKEGDDPDNAALPIYEDDADPKHAALTEFLKDKLAPEDLAQVHEMLGAVEEDEAPEEQAECETWDRRATDAKKRLGRDETPAEYAAREERESAADARARLGHDEDDDEMGDRRARDKLSRDWRQARDAHRRAHDACKADDARPDEDKAKEAADMRKRAADARQARDAMHRARDARRAHDKRARDKRAHDEPPPFNGRPNPGGTMEPITKGAMDAAITAAVQGERRNQHQVREAYSFVRPYIGDLALDAASPEEVYGATLRMKGIDIAGVHPSAYRRMVEMLPKPGMAQKPARLAQDGAAATSFDTMYPAAGRIGHA